MGTRTAALTRGPLSLPRLKAGASCGDFGEIDTGVFAWVDADGLTIEDRNCGGGRVRLSPAGAELLVRIAVAGKLA